MKNQLFPVPDRYDNWKDWAKAYTNWLLQQSDEIELIEPAKLAVTELPDPTENAGKLAYAFDEAGGDVLVIAHNGAWRTLTISGVAT